MGDNAARFLSTVLKGVKTECDEVCCVSDAYDPKDPAFFTQFVIIKRVGGR